MVEKLKSGRPPKNPINKRSKAVLVRMKPCEYKKISEIFARIQEKDDTTVNSLNDYIIKSAMGII